VRTLEFSVLPSQAAQLLGLGAGDALTGAGIDLGLAHPFTQRLGSSDTQQWCDPLPSRPTPTPPADGQRPSEPPEPSTQVRYLFVVLPNISPASPAIRASRNPGAIQLHEMNEQEPETPPMSEPKDSSPPRTSSSKS